MDKSVILSINQSVNQLINESINQSEFIHIYKYIQPVIVANQIGDKLCI